jgi:hypothetical protein
VSLDNRYSINYGWKVDPDGRENRLPGPVTTRTMTEEEIKKYGIVEKDEDEEMRSQRLVIDTEEILEVCRAFGTGKTAYEELARLHGISVKTAANMIYLRSIRKILADEKLRQLDNYEIIKETPQEDTVTSSAVELIPELSSNEGPINEEQETAEVPAEETIEQIIEDFAPAIAGIKIIDYLQDKLSPEQFEGFCIGNAINCLSEYRFMGGLSALKKAASYVDRIIAIKETA